MNRRLSADGVLQDYSIREVMAFDEARSRPTLSQPPVLTVDAALVDASRPQRAAGESSPLTRLIRGYSRLP